MIKKIVSLLLIATFSVLIVARMSALDKDVYLSEEVNTASALSFLKKEDKKSANEASKKIAKNKKKKAEALAKAQRQAAAKANVEKIHSGELSYKTVLKDLYIMGDSLMETINHTGLLSSGQTIAQVSVGLSHLESNMNTIISRNPQILLLHYGENHLTVSESGKNSFINQYRADIKKLQENLPSTRIIVSLLFPIKAYSRAYEQYTKYNEDLVNLCNELGVEYLDSVEFINERTQYYEPDRIHLKATFYSYWFDFIIVEKEII